MPTNDRLFVLLRRLQDDQLQRLWELMKSTFTRELDPAAHIEVRINDVSERLRKLATNDLRSLFRPPHKFSWSEILRSVAEKCGLDAPESAGDETLERTIWARADGNTDWIGVAAWARAIFKNPASLLVLPVIARVPFGPSYAKLIPAVFYLLASANLAEKVGVPA